MKTPEKNPQFTVGVSPMTFEAFQHLARLFVLGALDEDEMVAFEEGRREFDDRAIRFIQECRELNAAFALSLSPQPPRQDAKQRLMALVRASQSRTSAKPK